VVWLQGRRCESTSSLKLYVLERDFIVFPSFASEVKLLWLFLMPCSVRIFPLFNGGQNKNSWKNTVLKVHFNGREMAKKKTRQISLDMYREGPAGGPYTT
jgi:hypothetical protein